jgi:hypothetical protein
MYDGFAFAQWRTMGVLFLSFASFAITGCGDGGGGNTIQANASVVDFPLAEYNQSTANDCGLFDQDSTIQEAETGRECVRSAFEQCAESKFYIEFRQNNNQSFHSFVLTREDCSIRVHVVSNTDELPIGEALEICDELPAEQSPETACGIDED